MRLILSLLIPLTLSACTQAYFATLEALGTPKRELLVSRVEDARTSQKEAGKEFRSALERFRSVVKVQGGALAEKYDALADTLDRCEERAADVRSRITMVEEVADALFEEWESELENYSNPQLRRASTNSMKSTHERYKILRDAMRRAEIRLEPALKPLRDQVLFLKHNLNAEAISSIQGEVHQVEFDVSKLLSELEFATREADRFLADLDKV